MKILIQSDLHLEFGWDGLSLADQMPQADVLVLAGDITTWRNPTRAQEHLSFFTKKYQDVVMVSGNHEYYGTGFADVDEHRKDLRRSLPNLHWLDSTYCTIRDINFIGATLWFRDDPINAALEGQLNDFRQIRNFRSYVYKKAERDRAFLMDEVKSTDIVITHHLPLHQSVPEPYKDGDLNRFFVHNMSSLISQVQPRIWIHGHTHTPCDYYVGSTRVIANPKGYPGECNELWSPSKMIEVIC